VVAQPLSVAPDEASDPKFPISPAELADDQPSRAVPDSPHVTVVLPCYNEQDHVLAEIERITTALDASGYSYELMAIDDKSTDQTLARLREAEREHPELRVIAFRRNGGSGTVRRIGTRDARGKIVVWTDADMTYPNERIPELVRYLD